MKLGSAQRNALPTGRFGLPKTRQYPLPDEAHARLALERAQNSATPAQQAEIRRNVRRLYPALVEVSRQPGEDRS